MVREKSGRASFRVRGSGVCISMKAMEGRRRTMCEEGYLRSSSRSRYLSASVRLCVRISGVVTLPRRRLSARREVSRQRRWMKRVMYVIRQPVILQRIDILLRHCIQPSV